MLVLIQVGSLRSPSQAHATAQQNEKRKSKAERCEVVRGYIYSNGDAGFVLGSAKNGARVIGNNASSGTLNYYAVIENRSNGGIVGYMEASTISSCNVSNTKFILAGSDESMHSYFFGNHHYCKLQPAMGYVVGTLVSSALDADTIGISGNSYELQSDASLVGNESKNESRFWFREYDGKVGTSR